MFESIREFAYRFKRAWWLVDKIKIMKNYATGEEEVWLDRATAKEPGMRVFSRIA